MAAFRTFAAVAVAAILAVGAVRPAHADMSLVQPVQSSAARPTLADNLAQPVQPGPPARPAAHPAPTHSPERLAPTPCPCAAPPQVVIAFGPDGAPITGDLSHLRPSERLLGREQALRSEFGQQIHSGDRPWLPVVDGE